MNILVCEDEKQVRETIKKKLLSLTAKLKLEAQIELFASGEQLLEFFQKSMKEGLLFLDIEMKGLSGVETAKILREKYDYQGQIIFFTNHERYTMDSFALGDTKYLMKSLDDEVLEQQLQPLLNRISQSEAVYSVQLASGEGQSLYLKDLIMVETALLAKKDKLFVKTTHEKLCIQGSFNDFAEKLKAQNCLKINRRQIINIDNVQSLSERFVTMLDGTKVKVQGHYRQNLENKILKYVD